MAEIPGYRVASLQSTAKSMKNSFLDWVGGAHALD